MVRANPDGARGAEGTVVVGGIVEDVVVVEVVVVVLDLNSSPNQRKPRLGDNHKLD